MSIAEFATRRAGYPAPKFWTGSEYDRLVEMGAFTHQRVELINGVIYDMSPMNDPYAYAVLAAQYALLRCFPSDRFTVKIQSPMRLQESSRPEPDVAVLAGDWRQHKLHPTHALLVVEVADTSLDQDENQKASLYAMHGIADYWIVNLPFGVVTTYREPAGDKFDQVITYKRGGTVSPLAMPSAAIAVSDLLP